MNKVSLERNFLRFKSKLLLYVVKKNCFQMLNLNEHIILLIGNGETPHEPNDYFGKKIEILLL